LKGSQEEKAFTLVCRAEVAAIIIEGFPTGNGLHHRLKEIPQVEESSMVAPLRVVHQFS